MSEQLLLSNDITQVPLLAAWINSLGRELQLSDSCIFQLNLALEEAVVNVMNYAYPGEEGRPVLLTAKHLITDDAKERVVFTLIDEGIPFDPTQEATPDITLPAENRQIGGLGIFLVENLMENVVYQRKEERNVLVMTYLIERTMKVVNT